MSMLPPPPPPGGPAPPPPMVPPAATGSAAGEPVQSRFQASPPAPAPAGRGRLFAALGALVVVAAGTGAFFALRGGSGDERGAVDGAALLADVNQVMDTTKGFPDGRTATCPFGDIDDFAQRAPAALGAVATARLTEQSTLLERGDGRVLVCRAGDDAAKRSVAVFAGTPVDGAGPSTALLAGDDRSVTVGSRPSLRGGSVVTACGPKQDDANDVLCESIWFGGGVQLGVAVRGGPEVVAVDTQRWLEAVLDDLVAGVAGSDTTRMRPAEAIRS